MAGYTVYHRDLWRECDGRGYHVWMIRLVRPVNTSATMLPSEYREVCLHCGAIR